MTATGQRQGHQPFELIVRDEAVRLAPEGQLVGILCRPAPRAPAPQSSASAGMPSAITATAGRKHGTPDHQSHAGISAAANSAGSDLAFIILNAGVLHRVGPHRLHVTLARQIAADGVASLRLDLGGIGDSIASSDAASFRESAVNDTRTAMADLAALTGARKFVLCGVCAGADNSLATALVDDRVAGIVLIDPPVYATRRGQLRNLRAKLAEQGGPAEIVRWGAGVVQRRIKRTALAVAKKLAERRAASSDGAPEEEAPSQGREVPGAEVFFGQLTQILDKGVRVLAIYSGIHGPRYNHADQLFERFPALRGRVDHLYYPTANHTFTELSSQRELIEAIAGWMTKQFGGT